MTTATKKKLKASKCKKFPYCLGKGKQMPTFEEWFKGKNEPTDEDYEGYDDTFGGLTFYTKDDGNGVVFNLEEWDDVSCFEPEEKQDVKPFRNIYNKSYTVSVKCDSWFKDCCYTDYVGNGNFYLLAESGFYDDLEKISNPYVKKRIRLAFEAFLEDLCNSLDGISEENENWIGDWNL